MYQNELFNLQKQSATNYLAHEELLIAVEMLSAVALLNQALDSNDLVSVQNQLRSPAIGFNNLDETYVERYANELLSIKLEVLSQGQENLSWNEIQNCIDMVNIQIQEENDRIVAVGRINEAIDEGDPSKTLASLQLPTAKIKEVDPDYAQHYQDVLYYAKSQKQKDPASKILWLDEIQQAVYDANVDEDKAKQWVTLVVDVNQCLENKKSSDILSVLKTSVCNTNDVIPECADKYYDTLSKAKEQKSDTVSTEGPWLKLTLQEKYDYYYNVDSKENSWVTPESFLRKESWLMEKEIEDIVEEVTAGYIREKIWSASEDVLLRFDSTTSGPFIRKEYEARKSFLYDQEDNVVKIQAFWKGHKQRMSYLGRRQTFIDHIPSIVKIQAWFRMIQARRNYLARLQFFRDHKNEIVKIQSLLRASKARDDYKTLVGSENPPLSVIRKFVHLLDQSDLDFQEELEVARIRGEVVTKIRGNQQLEKDLNLMDIKIGLLVKNRITLEAQCS
uniref:IQ motif containing GTPase activating protein 2 n=1 Tax=Molossus molossus TaxID=27622 RepID=A0A7J8J0P2_MOLMO|nr:IQ motif containing GTPase activating protein 2 [Molossus molossus]